MVLKHNTQCTPWAWTLIFLFFLFFYASLLVPKIWQDGDATLALLRIVIPWDLEPHVNHLGPKFAQPMWSLNFGLFWSWTLVYSPYLSLA